MASQKYMKLYYLQKPIETKRCKDKGKGSKSSRYRSKKSKISRSKIKRSNRSNPKFELGGPSLEARN